MKAFPFSNQSRAIARDLCHAIWAQSLNLQTRADSACSFEMPCCTYDRSSKCHLDWILTKCTRQHPCASPNSCYQSYEVVRQCHDRVCPLSILKIASSLVCWLAMCLTISPSSARQLCRLSESLIKDLTWPAFMIDFAFAATQSSQISL